MLHSPYAPILRKICVEAGQIALRYWGQAQTRRKQDGSLVTDADEACEVAIVDALSREFPNHAIISEEGARTEGTGGTWYVDPIDGTSSFVEGLAHWGPTISLVQDGAFFLGAFWQPRLNDFWCAHKGLGAWKNGEKLLIQDHPKRMLSTHSLYGPSGMHRRGPLPWPGKLRALGTTAGHLALVASTPGSIAFVPRWKMWDIGNGILMVEQSGGVITDLSGQAWNPLVDPHQPFLAGSPRAIQHLIEQDTFSNDV